MDLELTDDQEALVDAFAAFLSKESPVRVVREAEPLGHDAELWRKTVAMGVPMMASPPEAGGGASMLDLALVGELVGRHLAPVPYVDTVVATRLLAAAGSDRWLAEANQGTVIALAVRAPVDGVARLVPSGAVASAVIVLDGDELTLIAGEGVPMANMAGAPLSDRAVDGDERVVLAGGERAHMLHRHALDEWRVLTASMLSGLASASLELAVAYTKQREQFGKPIAAFQSIAHRLADDATDAQGLQLLTRKASASFDDDPDDAPRLAAMAYLWGGEVANRISGNSLHLHGGYGFMLEYDIQLYYRRAKLWSVLLGDPRAGYAELGRGLFGASR